MPVGDFTYVIAGTDEPDQPPAPILLTIGEVATQLRMSEKSVRRRIKDGVIRVAPTGGRLVRISADEVRRLTAGGPLEEP
jgi:excisionase family DNA binding protein